MHAIAAIALLVLDVGVPARNDLQGSLTVHGREWRATDQSRDRPGAGTPTDVIHRPPSLVRAHQPIGDLASPFSVRGSPPPRPPPQGHLPEFLQPTTRARDRSRRLAERGDQWGRPGARCRRFCRSVSRPPARTGRARFRASVSPQAHVGWVRRRVGVHGVGITCRRWYRVTVTVARLNRVSCPSVIVQPPPMKRRRSSTQVSPLYGSPPPHLFVGAVERVCRVLER